MATVLDCKLEHMEGYQPSRIAHKIFPISIPLYMARLPKTGEIYLTYMERERLRRETPKRLHRRYLLG